MTFVDVILPLNLRVAYTYSVPEEWIPYIEVGKRVLVSFGKNKFYTALIIKIHSKAPEYAKIKSIEEVIDSTPIVFPYQITFWNWVADYYLESIGLIMDLALPASLKLSSQRVYILNPDQTAPQDLSEEEWMLYDAIVQNGKLSHREIKSFSGKSSGYKILNALIQKTLVLSTEEINDKNLTKKERFIWLHHSYVGNNELINQAFERLKKSPKQYEIFLKFLQIAPKGEKISKSEFLIKTETSSSNLSGLIEKNILEEAQVAVDRIQIDAPKNLKPIELSIAQKKALSEIEAFFKTKNTVLLRGITGSGKTEVYMQFLQKVFSNGGTALLLLPEITLTAQMLGRLHTIFGQSMVVYHSQVPQNQKHEIWNRVYKGEIRFVVGTRSAIFLPFRRLDAAIVDEEHDSALRQTDTTPRYHGRDCLLYLAHLLNTKVILGSATPSVESYFNTTTEKYGLVELNQRFSGVEMPLLEIIDLKKSEKERNMKSHFSMEMYQQIENNLAENRQMMLFHNRRGFAPYIQCNTCEYTMLCDQCDVRLTYHSTIQLLMCHYCNKKYPLPKICPECAAPELKTRGLGTQKLEEEMQLFFPSAQIARLDTDVAKSNKKINDLLEAFKKGETNVLIGTQMISKGLDFENLNWVGVVNADALLHFIEYNTHEKAFQTLVQICGRVGRRQTQGKVVIQTYTPSDPILYFLKNQDWLGFVQKELSLRKEFIFPPFCFLIKIIVRHKNHELLELYVNAVAKKLKTGIKSIVLGPTKPNIAKIQNHYIREILIKIPKNKEAHSQKMTIRDILDKELILISNKNFRIDIIVDF